MIAQVEFGSSASGYETKFVLENPEGLIECMGGRDTPASADNAKLPPLEGALLGDREERLVVSVPKYGEDGLSIGLVDRIVTPLAGGNVAAVEREKLAQLVSVEECLARWSAIVVDSIELTHWRAKSPKMIGVFETDPSFDEPQSRAISKPRPAVKRVWPGGAIACRGAAWALGWQSSMAPFVALSKCALWL